MRTSLSFLLTCSACGTTLLVTSQPSSDALVPKLKRAGAALRCHERASELFQVFLFCPGRRQVLGIARSEGKISVSCPDLNPRACRKLFERVRGAVESSLARGTARFDARGSAPERRTENQTSVPTLAEP